MRAEHSSNLENLLLMPNIPQPTHSPSNLPVQPEAPLLHQWVAEIRPKRNPNNNIVWQPQELFVPSLGQLLPAF
jgi:hypothetical protein